MKLTDEERKILIPLTKSLETEEDIALAEAIERIKSAAWEQGRSVGRSELKSEIKNYEAQSGRKYEIENWR